MTPESASASSPAVRQRMQQQKTRNTGVEIALRSELHRRGFRFRVHRRPLRGVRREADIINASIKLAVFVDGCFWHGCPTHATWPKANDEFWRRKIEGNRERDRDTDRRLEEAGWSVVRVWEHESVSEAADRVMTVVEQLRSAGSRP